MKVMAQRDEEESGYLGAFEKLEHFVDALVGFIRGGTKVRELRRQVGQPARDFVLEHRPRSAFIDLCSKQQQWCQSSSDRLQSVVHKPAMLVRTVP
jgi:hypothetical protein